jgi:hypothetical protein
MTGKVAGLLVALVVVMGARRSAACAGCRNPTLPVARGSEGPLAERSLRLGATLTGSVVRVRHEAGCRELASCSEVPVQPLYIHDQTLFPLELRLTGEYAFTRHFGFELQLPLRAVRTTIHYTTPSGAPYEPLDPGIHHRDETVAGPADPWLLYRVGTRVAGAWIALRSGISLPLGRTEEDPFELGDRGLRHQHVQLGSGTLDPVGILEVSRAFDDLSVQAFAQAQAALYENRHGYRAPLRVYGGAAVGYPLAGDLRGTLGVEALHEGSERWKGVVRQDGNLGRNELLAAVSLGYTFGHTELNLGVRVPFFRHIVRGSEDVGELSSPLILTLGASHEIQ